MTSVADPLAIRRAAADPEEQRSPAKDRRGGRLLAVIAALILVTVVAAYLATRAAGPAKHRIEIGVSAYPANVTATWRGADGATHPIDPWQGAPVYAEAREVVVAVASVDGGPVQCILTIDTEQVAAQTTGPDVPIAVCSWVG